MRARPHSGRVRSRALPQSAPRGGLAALLDLPRIMMGSPLRPIFGKFKTSAKRAACFTEHFFSFCRANRLKSTPRLQSPRTGNCKLWEHPTEFQKSAAVRFRTRNALDVCYTSTRCCMPSVAYSLGIRRRPRYDQSISIRTIICKTQRALRLLARVGIDLPIYPIVVGTHADCGLRRFPLYEV